jgi:hypothetical protein
MEVTFKHPPVKDAALNLSLDPFKDFDPSNKYHYPDELGIYIYGLKLLVNDEVKFIPLYVGITKTRNLIIRLYNEHYLLNGAQGKGEKKELWDFSANRFSLKDIYFKYAEMHHYDFINNEAGKSRVYCRSEHYINELLYLKQLIYFQNQNYFKIKTGQAFGAHSNIDQMPAIAKYPTIGKKIMDTKQKYTTNFYFVYASMDDILEKNIDLDKNNWIEIAENIELATKKALNIIGVHTTASTSKKAKLIDMDIDLRDIEGNLINLGGHPYNLNGQYKNLIIKVRR